MSDNRVSQKAWKVSVGAGVLGAIVVALKYALRPATKRRVPDSISSAVFTTKVLHTSLGEVVYHESGTGKTLIFVHDLCCGGCSYEWSKVYPEFAGSFRVIALDMVGFGESSRPEMRFTPGGYVRMLAEFTRAVTQEEAPRFVGSGLGGGLCVLMASEHPELVGGLLLHRPHGGAEIGAQHLPLANRIVYRIPLLGRFLYRNHLSTRNAMATWLRRIAFFDPEKVTEETVEVFATCAQQPGAEHAVLSWLSGSLSFDFQGHVHSCRCPVTLLEAASLMAPLEAPREMAEAIASKIHS